MTLWLIISYGTANAYLLCLVALRRSWMAPWLNFCALYLLCASLSQAFWPKLAFSTSIWWRRYMLWLALLKFCAVIEAALAMCYPMRVGQKALRIFFACGVGAMVCGAWMLQAPMYPRFPNWLLYVRLGANVGGAMTCMAIILWVWANPRIKPMQQSFTLHTALLGALLMCFGVGIRITSTAGSLREWVNLDGLVQIFESAVLLYWANLFRKCKVKGLNDARQLFYRGGRVRSWT